MTPAQRLEAEAQKNISQSFEAEKRGDYKAAQASDCMFFPINPQDEEASWRRLNDEGIDRFLGGRFTGEFQSQIVQEFESLLPEHPPWSAEK